MLESYKKSVQRLGIFYFSDKNHTVDRYICHMLREMNVYLSELCIVCDSNGNKQSEMTLASLADRILVNDNAGFNVGAYKLAINIYGWDTLKTFDEVIFFDNNIMGPVYPLNEFFEKMEERNLDYWGICKHYKLHSDPFGIVEYGYWPEYIQACFIAVRNNMLASMEFREYWDNMPCAYRYEEAQAFYEISFTKHFSDKGFRYDTYCQTDHLEDYASNPFIYYAKFLVEEQRCPFFRRDSFYWTYMYYFQQTCGEPAMELYNYLNKSTTYDITMIWETLLRTCNMADLVQSMQLTYMLPSIGILSEKAPKRKVALILHLYYTDQLDMTVHYASSMPEDADLIVTTDSEDKRKAILTAFKQVPCGRLLSVIIVENRGRDVSALLVGCKHLQGDYDYICFAHDKKSSGVNPMSIGESFAYKCFENILGTKDLVENILSTFEANPCLGILSPPAPNHGPYSIQTGNAWTCNFQATYDLLSYLEIEDVDIRWEKEPIAPLGTMFWFRPAALKALYQKEWQYDQFPAEPIPPDGTLLHAIERAYPFVAQHEGFYSAWLISTSFSSIEFTNLEFMLDSINVELTKKADFKAHWHMLEEIPSMTFSYTTKPTFKDICRRLLPKWIWRRLQKIKRRYAA